MSNKRQKVRVGVIGAGVWASTSHLPTLMTRKDEIEMVGVCRKGIGELNKVAQDFGFQVMSEDYRDVLNQGIDLCVVSSPVGFHFEHAKAALESMVHEAASRLGPDWDIEIVEMHHRMKVDAPSGTAKLLGEAAAKGRHIDLASNSERGRDGITGARSVGAIGFASLRGGTVAGDHSVIFASDEESITISHRAENRAIFARGAVKAAIWLAAQQRGRYNMPDVLGL